MPLALDNTNYGHLSDAELSIMYKTWNGIDSDITAPGYDVDSHLVPCEFFAIWSASSQPFAFRRRMNTTQERQSCHARRNCQPYLA
jgi:hypothetical protein